MYSTCPECSTECWDRDLIKFHPCGCKICYHCIIKLQAEMPCGDTLTHCNQNVVKHEATRLIRKRNCKPEAVTVYMDYPQKKKPKPDEKRPKKPPIPFRTGDFLREEFKRGTVSKTVGKGLLVTEQWLLHPGPGGEKSRPN